MAMRPYSPICNERTDTLMETSNVFAHFYNAREIKRHLNCTQRATFLASGAQVSWFSICVSLWNLILIWWFIYVPYRCPKDGSQELRSAESQHRRFVKLKAICPAPMKEWLSMAIDPTDFLEVTSINRTCYNSMVTSVTYSLQLVEKCPSSMDSKISTHITSSNAKG